MTDARTRFDRRSWGALLARVDREVCALTPREYIHCERLLAAWSGRRTTAELRAGLASLLARDPAEWEAIGRLFDDHVGAGAAVAKAGESEPRTKAPPIVSVPPPERIPFETLDRAVRRLLAQGYETLVNLPRPWWLVIMIVPVLMYVAASFVTVDAIEEVVEHR